MSDDSLYGLPPAQGLYRPEFDAIQTVYGMGYRWQAD